MQTSPPTFRSFGRQDTILAALPRRARLIEYTLAETLEAQRIFLAESIGIFDGIVETIGSENLSTLNIGSDDGMQDSLLSPTFFFLFSHSPPCL